MPDQRLAGLKLADLNRAASVGARLALKSPITVDGERTGDLELRRVRRSDLRRFRKASGWVSESIVVAAALTRLSEEQVRSLGVRDFRIVMESIGEWMEELAQKGETSNG